MLSRYNGNISTIHKYDYGILLLIIGYCEREKEFWGDLFGFPCGGFPKICLLVGLTMAKTANIILSVICM